MPKQTLEMVLKNHLQELNIELERIDAEREKLLKEKEKTETHLNLLTPKRRRPISYDKETTFKQKVIYCLKVKSKVLSINDMLDILFEVDKDLKADEKNVNKSIRLAVFRMVKDEELMEYKSNELKMIHYALPNWKDENDSIEDEYIK